jgi:thiamine phosphate synthase YjbQ (UPF0047 family)
MAIVVRFVRIASEEKLIMGTWQQAIFADCDTRLRQRSVRVRCVGE